MPKKEITKRKVTFAIDKEIDKEIVKISRKMKLKKSYIVNVILRGVLLDKHFDTAGQLMVGNGK